MDGPVRVLLVEDDEDDYLLTRDLLRDIPGGHFTLDRAATYEAGLGAVGRGEHDVYLIDYRLGEHTGLELVREAVRRGCRAPVVHQIGAMLEREVTHPAQLLDDTMDVSRITRGKIALRLGPTDLGATVTHTLEVVRPLLEERGHRVTVNVPGTPVWVRGDALR